MRRMLNTLYVTTFGAYLSKKNETLHVSIEGERVLSLPLHTLEGVVCWGSVGASPPLMHALAENGTLLTFLSRSGRYLATVRGPVSGNITLRREQFRIADAPERAAGYARSFVLAKLRNSQTLLLRAARDRDDTANKELLRDASSRIAALAQGLAGTPDVSSLIGIEGEAASTYFRVFDHLVLHQKKDFCFSGRNKRPPLDNINCLLSFFYTLLAHDVSAALQAVGLDVQLGFMHQDRPGRPSLALDLMEELRPYMVDRFVLSCINRKQTTAKDFKTTQSGGIVLCDEARKRLITLWQDRKREVCVKHPFLKEKIELGLIPHAQAVLLARTIRGDLDAYPPFVWR